MKKNLLLFRKKMRMHLFYQEKFVFALFFSIFVFTSVMAQGGNLQNTKILLPAKTMTVEQLIEQIEKQTNYYFVVNNDHVDINTRISLNKQNANVAETLKDAFEETNIAYKISGKNIVLLRKGQVEKTTLTQQSQKKKVQGKVLDYNGEPLIGVTVQEKNTTNRTMTDFEGNYSLELRNPNSSIVVSYIGFDSQIITPSANQVIKMKPSNEELNEIVVIGYGTARKTDLTGSTSSLNGERLTDGSNPNLSAQLQGQLAGVQVSRNSGDQAGGASIRIHGVTTISTNDPLVIIDGIPGSLDDVAPEDVKDVQVLKDAASAAIYGSRAAAGVILVSTKRATNREFKMNYNFEYGYDVPTEAPDYANGIDWMVFKNELTYNDGGKDLYGVYTKDYINSYAANHAKNPDQYPLTDWKSYLVKNSTQHQRHSFTLSGGSDKLLSNFSLNYFKGGSFIPGKEFERVNSRLNNDYKINDWIHANVDINLRMDNHTTPNSQMYPMYYIHYSHPLYTPIWSNGLVSEGRDGENPYAMLHLNGHNKTRGYGLTGKIGIDLTPIKGLTISAVASPFYYVHKGKNWKTRYDMYDINGNVYDRSKNSSTTKLTESRNDSHGLTLQLYANYELKLLQHTIRTMVGYEEYAFHWENLGAWRNNYQLSSFPYLDLGPSSEQFNNGNAGHNAYRSYFGRLMYSYANRYMLQANIRTDGSSRFAKGHRWGTFPSISAGWVMSEESWMKDNKIVDYLKLRASVGQLGNERIGSEFPYQASMQFSNTQIANTTTGTADAVQIAYQAKYAFRDITWETTTTYGFGIDASFLKNRLRTSFDWYHKKTKNMLLEMNFPSYSGYNAPEQNAGDMHTTGWEVELAWNDRIQDLRYGASFNLSDYRSKMGYLGGLRRISDNYITEEGSYYNEWYLYKNKGIILNKKAMYDANGKKIALRGNETPGCIRFEDIDGDGRITGDKDRVHCGNSMPEMQFGGSLWAMYKNFDFNLSYQGIGRWMKYIHRSMIRPLEWGWAEVPAVLVGNHWSPYNTDEQNATMKYPMASWAHEDQLYSTNDFWLYNAAYLRVKNIAVGYTVPAKFTQKVYVNKLRFYVSINGLPAIRLASGGIDGWDPEQGIDTDYLMTSLIFGVNITF